MVELTPKQQIFKELFEMLYEKKDVLRKTILYHMTAHEEDGHVPVPLDPEELNHPDPSTGAKCIICGKHLGWYCPKSLDHICHYEYDYTKRGYLTPEGDYSCEEMCVYCGQPSERK